MGRIIQVPDEGFVRRALVEAEHALFDKTFRRFSLMLDRADETGLHLSAARNDGAVGTFTAPVCHRYWFSKEPSEHVNAWIQGKIGEFVGTLALGMDGDEPTPQAETEQRYAVAIVFGGRPDVVLTPAAGVPADEAVRVFQSFATAAATIGGRPAMLPLAA